ncbi:MAG: FkbM family methyltransferase [Candidatus Acidiferrales bacterium]
MGYAKARIEAFLRERLFGSRIFPPARTTYQFFFNRGKLESRRRMRRFYSEFIHDGDLVFDVGANVGIYSEIFSELGAEVIAIEPNPSCCRLLQNLARNRRVKIETCALGDAPGKTLLRLSDNRQLSSVNPDWCKKLEQSTLHRNSRWVGEMEVEVTTLDRLAARYGIPNFVKIDVEGFDDAVMRGMSFKPEVLTFEFNRLLPAVAARCLEAPVVISGYEFNFVHGGKMQCAAQNWLLREVFAEHLDALVAEEPSGDVIARRIARG